MGKFKRRSLHEAVTSCQLRSCDSEHLVVIYHSRLCLDDKSLSFELVPGVIVDFGELGSVLANEEAIVAWLLTAVERDTGCAVHHPAILSVNVLTLLPLLVHF